MHSTLVGLLGESPAVVTAACVILAGIAGRMVLLWNLHSVVYNLVHHG